MKANIKIYSNLCVGVYGHGHIYEGELKKER